MPYLNWKETSLKQEMGAHPLGLPDQHLLELGISRAQLEQLLFRLVEVFRGPPEAELRPELRLDLPQGWIIFWKLREGESRLLLAHPQENEWVTTAALTPAHAALFLERLEKLSEPGQAVQLSELAPTGRVSNTEVRIHLL